MDRIVFSAALRYIIISSPWPRQRPNVREMSNAVDVFPSSDLHDAKCISTSSSGSSFDGAVAAVEFLMEEQRRDESLDTMSSSTVMNSAFLSRAWSLGTRAAQAKAASRASNAISGSRNLGVAGS
eukprot:Amastigsp_a845766_106.p3 type:complete len:125 gc:universal Amastigsp_a845766_106:650-276(-)